MTSMNDSIKPILPAHDVAATGAPVAPHHNNAMIQVQPPRREDLQPSYAQHLENDDVSAHGWYGGMSTFFLLPTHIYIFPSPHAHHKTNITPSLKVNTLGQAIGTFGAIPCCICCPNPYRSVNQGNVGLVTKFGRFYRAVDPGLVKVNPLSEKLIQVDVKIQIVGTFFFREGRVVATYIHTYIHPSIPFPHQPIKHANQRLQRSPNKSA